MARFIQPSCKRCRRYGEKLFLKGDKCNTKKCPFEIRPRVPGMHGQSGRRKKITDYGIHLHEKQKAKFYYGVMESQFKGYYNEAARQRLIPTGDRLIQLLESRLDNVVFRLGLATSRAHARQIILHRKVKVNNHFCNIPSYSVRPGEKISFVSSVKDNVFVKEALSRNASVSEWITFNAENMEAEVLSLPQKEQVQVPFNEQFIVEFYSK
ncbi:MAG: 30S ribosomal protein S4 [Caldisericia bacterium]|nr:30S ribosomal protein S4 [Caldisericia bacterium]MDD4615331.1 30S ribosomal protein S4 [Caldisericia bacterium]